MARAKIKILIDENGKKESVLLPFKEYQELMADLVDLATIAERKDHPSESLDDVKKRLEGNWRSTGSK